jgi:hypothetical protein
MVLANPSYRFRRACVRFYPQKPCHQQFCLQLFSSSAVQQFSCSAAFTNSAVLSGSAVQQCSAVLSSSQQFCSSAVISSSAVFRGWRDAVRKKYVLYMRVRGTQCALLCISHAGGRDAVCRNMYTICGWEGWSV